MPPLWLILPFVLLLGMIATGPLFYERHWHANYPRYAVGLGLFVALVYLLGPLPNDAVVHAVEEYTSFIALLLALFVASGTVLIKTDLAGTARANTGLLLVGSVLANVIGTTGASMLLIRPFLRMNRGRVRPYHVVFFIFTVSNVGGLLTPIGDPPLFLGFLRGVPFLWTLQHLWYLWVPALGAILTAFYVIDSRNKDESVRERAVVFGDEDVEPGEYTEIEPTHTRRHFSLVGYRGVAWLAVIVGAVFLDPAVMAWVPDLHALGVPVGIREIVMIAAAYGAYATASPEALAGNEFNFEPIKEVAWLFIGIFLTMQPALELIAEVSRQNAAALTPAAFYYGTGTLSEFLDNAPTYVAFLSAAMGAEGLDVDVPAQVAAFSSVAGPGWLYVQAISLGAVLWGAVTYIGNGPNFMVKAIAESRNVECPTFLGYVVRYSLPILVPIYVLIWIAYVLIASPA